MRDLVIGGRSSRHLETGDHERGGITKGPKWFSGCSIGIRSGTYSFGSSHILEGGVLLKPEMRVFNCEHLHLGISQVGAA